MKKKAKKWFSCITAAALVMSTVNLPIDVLASDFEDGVETSVEDEQMDFSDMENSEDLEIEDVPEDVLVEEETDTEEGASDLEIETELFTDTEEITESTDEILSETGSEINTFSSRAGGMTTGENGYSLIKQFESCRLTAYKAVSTEKYYTIEWGHYGSDVYAGMTITQAQADQYLKQDVAKTENSVNSFLNSNRITIGQNQFDALVSFTYNLGNVWVSTETFQLKTILKNGYTKYSDAQIRTAFTNWNKSGGQVLAGLTRRRNAEADLFLSNRKPDPTPTPIPIPQGSVTISDGEYHIVSALDSSKALDVCNQSKDNTANIQIYSNLADGTETFHITYIGNGAYKIINSNSGRCLDVDGAGMTAGTNVQQYDYVGADQQQWIIQEDNGWFNIISKKNGLYLDVEDGNSSNGANVRVWNGNGSDAQRWRFVAWGDNIGETVSEGRYHIVSALDGATKGLDVYCAAKDNGTNIQISDNLNDDKQTFDLTYLGKGYYKIINTNSGKSLDVQAAGTKQGSNIQQYDYVYGGVNQQQWIIKESSGGWFNIISKHNGLCLDVAAENGSNVQGWTCNGSDRQKWRFIVCGSDDGQTISDDEYHIVSALDEKQGLDVENCSKEDGANIQIYPNTWDAKETFHVSYLGNGYYKIINSYSGKSLDVMWADTRRKTNLQQYGYNGVNQQQWILRKTSDGYYKIISKASGLCVDVENGVVANNANVWMWTSNETKAQKWKFIPVKKDLSGYSLSLSQDTYSYDGTEKAPDVTVKNGTITLVKGSDYSVSYTNNINAGTATVTITGTGKYTGKITRQFKINKASQNLTVSIDKTDLAIGETAQIKASGQGQITYKSSAEDKVTVSSTGVITGKQAGDATITITAAGTENYNSAIKELVIHVLKDCVGNKHTWDSGKITKQPTCTEDGKKTYTCTTCGTTKTENLSATGHAWDNGKITREATCTTDGQRTYTCATCKNIKTESISKTGHKEVKDVAVSATCENAGKTEGSHCSVCNTVIKKQEILPATGHTWDSGKVTTAATCTTDGEKNYTCTTCHKTRTESIPKTGHTEVKDAATPATCENTGKTEGSHCSICGTVLKKQETLPVLGHTWDSGKVTKAATCTTDGEKTYTCTTCHKTRIESVPKTGHTEIKDAAVSAACESTGKTEGSHCSICGTVIKAQEIIPATGHDEVTKFVKKATCEVEGYTGDIYCKKCGKMLKEGKVIEKLSHDWKQIGTKKATCTTSGENTYTCTHCNKNKTEQVPATGHKWSAWKKIPMRQSSNHRNSREPAACVIFHRPETMEANSNL